MVLVYTLHIYLTKVYLYCTRVYAVCSAYVRYMYHVDEHKPQFKGPSHALANYPGKGPFAHGIWPRGAHLLGPVASTRPTCTCRQPRDRAYNALGHAALPPPIRLQHQPTAACTARDPADVVRRLEELMQSIEAIV